MKNQFASFDNYLTEVYKNSRPGKRVIAGNFYAFEYRFDKTQAFEKIKAWDKYPLIYTIAKVGDNYLGLNFHHLPVKARRIWFSRFNRLNNISDKNRRVKIMYSLLKTLYTKALFAIRLYNPKNIFYMRRIETPKLPLLFEYYSNTYYGINIEQMEFNFNNYKRIV